MKYLIAVFLGAASYGILSTFVVLAYGEGFTLGEVVGSQLFSGFILVCGLALWTKLRQRHSDKSDYRSVDGSPSLALQTTAIRTAHTRLTWKQKALLMAAGMPTGITGLLYYESLRYVPASLAIILLFQFTWISVLVQAWIERRRPNAIIFVSLLVIFGGTFLAAGIIEYEMGRFHPLGVVWGLLSSISYTLFILFNGRAIPSAPPAYRSMWMVGGALVLVFILFPPHFIINGTLLSTNLFFYGFLLGLFGAFIPPVLFAIGIPRIGEGMAGIIGASELPVAVLMSMLVLGETVSLFQWIGVCIVLIGIAIPELMRKRRHVSRTIM